MDAINRHWKMMDGLRRLGAEAERRMHPFCTVHSITPLQLNLLITIRKNGPQTVSGLAKRTNMADANNSALCKKLEKDGFVLRERDPEDERQVLVSLSPKGRQIVAAFAESCKGQHQNMGTIITEQEMADILKGFETLQMVLEKLANDDTHQRRN